MVEPEDLLGHGALADRILDAFQAGTRVHLVVGAPGVGKSTLATERVARRWREQCGGTVLVACGDPGRAHEDYFPLRNVSRRISVDPFADVLAAGETFAGTGGLIGGVVRSIARTRMDLHTRRMPYLGDAEQEILYWFDKRARKQQPLLLIADDLHRWDAKSLDLLRTLISPELLKSHPRFREMRILAVETSHDAIAQPRAHDDFLVAAQAKRTTMERIPPEQFHRVMNLLVAPTVLSADESAEIHALSGGHLLLAKEASRIVAARGASALTGVSDFDDLIRILFAPRMHALGGIRSPTSTMLQVAAILGQAFDRRELSCATRRPEGETDRLLRRCREERLLLLDERNGFFAHDLLHRYFMSIAGDDKVTIHEQLLSCLRVFRSSDYENRCLNAVAAERPDEAGVLGVQAALQRERSRRGGADTTPEPVLAAISAVGLDEARDRLVDAQRELGSKSLAQLDALSMRGLAGSLLAESAYLRAMLLLSTRSEADREEARSLLEKWSASAKEEPELQFRMLRALLYGLTHLPDKTAARELESRIHSLLVDRLEIDPAARDELYMLDRNAGSLHQPDVALRRIRGATEYFEADDDGAIRRPIELYRCLVNLAANQIAVGRYAEARDTAVRTTALVDSYEERTFPRPEFVATNALLAEYRLGEVTAHAAAARQQRIADRAEATADPFYVQNALAVYLALDGRYDRALEIYDALALLLTARSIPEPSMRYLIAANRISTRFLAGDRHGLLPEWRALDTVVAQIAYPIRPLLQRRHELLTGVLAARPPESPRAFDERLVTRYPDEFGPLWDHFGRGFRLPEIELWREA